MIKNLFSVIMPVYEESENVDDAMKCLKDQTIGFENNIQVTILNFSNRSFEQYGDNVEVLDCIGQTLSRARNMALDRVNGEFVVFYDSNDIWDKYAFEKSLAIFTKNINLSVVTGTYGVFDVHSLEDLDAEKNELKTVNIIVNPTKILTNIGPCFFRYEAIEDWRFNESLSVSEDLLFLNEVVLDLEVYGESNGIHCFYRKELDPTSLSNNVDVNSTFQNLEICEKLVEMSLEDKDDVYKYIQSLVVFVISIQMFKKIDEEFSPEDAKKWEEKVHSLLNQVEDTSFTKSKLTNLRQQFQMMRMKYDNFDELFSINEKGKIYVGETYMTNFNAFILFNFAKIDIKNDILFIEGYSYMDCVNHGFEFYCKETKSGETYSCKMYDFEKFDDVLITGNTVHRFKRFTFEVPVQAESKLSFFVTFPNISEDMYRLNPGFRKYALLDRAILNSYTILDKYIVKYIGKKICVYPNKFKTHLASEVRRLREIRKNDKFDKATRRKYVRLRLKYHFYSLFHKKKTWLFMDKEWAAGDNAENLYRYAVKQNKTDDLFFAIQKDSEYFDSINSYGRVIEPYDDKYKVIYLKSDYMISSRREPAVIDPFGGERDFVKDLFHQNFCYLTHGTLFGDLSNILNKVNNNFALYLISANCEYENLLTGKYGYTDKEVKLVGMARYDGYESAQVEKKIAFLPTWRFNIAGKIIPGTTEREYNPLFNESEYCKFYNSLINDEKLIATMKKYSYTGEFYVHPAFEKQACDFIGNDTISVGDGSANYEKVLKESAMLITDFSGVGFDFGYQRRPLVYPHFDSIFSGNKAHTYGNDNYFDYETEGFGPVTYTVEDTVNAIVNYLENDCQLEDEYISRADKFFAYSDYNNCQRIYDEIMKLDV